MTILIERWRVIALGFLVTAVYACAVGGGYDGGDVGVAGYYEPG